MKLLELSQDEIDVLWSAVIAQASTERVLMKATNNFDNFQKHSHREMICCLLEDKLYNFGVTNVNIRK